MDTRLRNSQTFYDALHHCYDAISGKRNKYNEKINRIIAEATNSMQKPVHWLDVGCGNGSRTMELYGKIKNLKTITGVDNSANMLHSFRLKGESLAEVPLTLICSDFTQSQEISSKFELITTLWNVFGHIDSQEGKAIWLQNIKKMLAEDGVFFMDFNNSYNLEYGFFRAIKNIALDIIGKKKATFVLSIDDVSTGVYIHSPYELDNLIIEAGLCIKERIFVSYKTGNRSRLPIFYGQVLLQIGHK